MYYNKNTPSHEQRHYKKPIKRLIVEDNYFTLAINQEGKVCPIQWFN